MSKARGQSPMRRYKRRDEFRLTTNQGNKINKAKFSKK
jgi:hypothetical protein|tara:strand:- start:2882 stop:2995 length:114 start_codon:yes stop_codon:yes gene_type:complete